MISIHDPEQERQTLAAGFGTMNTESYQKIILKSDEFQDPHG